MRAIKELKPKQSIIVNLNLDKNMVVDKKKVEFMSWKKL